jgi:hypothetical protein
MNDLFLKWDGATDEKEAMDSSILAALQRNKVYVSDDEYSFRSQFREEWATLIRNEAKPYREVGRSISDDEHCAAIQHIADELSERFSEHLVGRRLRFGTSQKAFNCYLKYLWALGEIATPPHCPIDGVVLKRVGISDSWTRCDSREQYMGWINAIRQHLTLSEWENEVWFRWRLSNS